MRFGSVAMAMACAAALTMSSCSHTAEPSGEQAYQLTIDADPVRGIDTVEVYVLQPHYDRLIRYATLTSLPATIDGCVGEPMVAFLRISTDSAARYFVLEPGKTTITLGNGFLRLAGSTLSRDCIRKNNERKRLVDERKQNFIQYLQASDDGSLTAEIEHRYFKTDSLLADSLEKLQAQILALPQVQQQILTEKKAQ